MNDNKRNITQKIKEFQITCDVTDDIIYLNQQYVMEMDKYDIEQGNIQSTKMPIISFQLKSQLNSRDVLTKSSHENLQERDDEHSVANSEGDNKL